MKRCSRGHEYKTRCYKCRAAYNDKAYKAIPRPWRDCPICGQYAPMTVDHIKPLHKGGTNDPSNLRYVCRECNSAKQ